ncbi:hypothetical protein [Vagococcus xieshaowenii]|uniref:Beta-lactamase class A n=1 Tax=Vagococcus xieshaowenii TaxID=2562451 RepID=A0AAJ5EFG7_9ENTE|nr:hypothetical protein [Vagococcus xieshaowenii]QCA28548.1 hypothetical protein E4Z98_04170 [Vagococcus xieshaowenii]TFZ40644.1 hypothetical protein E4031_07605 [Vagococcus xieshaowenii]
MNNKIINSKVLLLGIIMMSSWFMIIFKTHSPTHEPGGIEVDETISEVKQLVDMEQIIINLAKKQQDEHFTNQMMKMWQALLEDETTKFDVAIYDEKTHNYVTFSNKEVPHFYTASIAKVGVLMEVLALDEKGVSGLSVQEKNNANLMITKSNNEVTHQFVKQRLGSYLEIDHLFDSLGMEDTKANKETWGLIQTDALDQVKLINAIFSQQPYNRSEDVSYIKQLMANVDKEQRWGVSKNATDVYLKNGWLSLDGQTWLVNSIGKINDPQANYSIAVLTEGNKSFNDGIRLIETIAGATYNEITKLTAGEEMN